MSKPVNRKWRAVALRHVIRRTVSFDYAAIWHGLPSRKRCCRVSYVRIRRSSQDHPFHWRRIQPRRVKRSQEEVRDLEDDAEFCPDSPSHTPARYGKDCCRDRFPLPEICPEDQGILFLYAGHRESGLFRYRDPCLSYGRLRDRRSV